MTRNATLPRRGGGRRAATTFDAKALPETASGFFSTIAAHRAGLLASAPGTAPSRTPGRGPMALFAVRDNKNGGLQLRDSSRFTRDSLLASRPPAGKTSVHLSFQSTQPLPDARFRSSGMAMQRYEKNIPQTKKNTASGNNRPPLCPRIRTKSAPDTYPTGTSFGPSHIVPIYFSYTSYITYIRSI